MRVGAVATTRIIACGADMTPPRLTVLEIVAQCWCDPRISGRTLDVDLAKVFAEKLEQAVALALSDQGVAMSKLLKKQFDMGVDTANEEIERLQAALKDHHKAIQASMLQEAYEKGFEECREMAARLINLWTVCGPEGPRMSNGDLIIDRIKALHPGAK